MRRRVLDTSHLGNARIWEDRIRQVLVVPAAVPPVPGSSIHHLRADDRAVLIANFDLLGPLADLVMTVLASGDRC